MAMMMMRIFSLLLICSSLNADILNFKIPNNGQSSEILSLKANAEAIKLIRNNAYLSLGITSFDPSVCWLNFIKNKKIQIQLTNNSHKLVKQDSSYFFYDLDLNPKKINITNVTKQQFIKFCENKTNKLY